MSNGDHAQLVAMHEANPKCYWCGRMTWLPNSGERLILKGAKARMATRDHLISRNEGDPLSRGSEVVLACYRCNCKRAENEHAAMDREVWNRKSQPVKYGYVNLRHALAVDPNYLDVELRKAQ